MKNTAITFTRTGRSGLLALASLAVITSSSNSMFAEEACKSPPSFLLETLVDFPDDSLGSRVVITSAHIDAMMVAIQKLGVTRVSWAYYGDGHGGYLLPSGFDDKWRNYADTLTVLENPLRIAVEAAHRNGLEIYAYYKPYETGPAVYFPCGSPEARAYGRILQRGGWLTWLDPFVAEHPDLRLRHQPDSSIQNLDSVAICTIKLTKRDASPTRVNREHLQIWSSRLNYRYQPLNIPFKVNEAVEPSAKEVHDLNGALVIKKGDPVRTLALSGFQLTDPYILVTTDFVDGTPDFENTGTDIFTALDVQGDEIPGVFATGSGIWNADRVDFRNWGLIFDVGFGRGLVHLDTPNTSGRQGLIAFARGRNEYLPGALCETEPQVRAYWLSCIDEMLDAGVDGIDFRIENHSTHTDFSAEYGFNDAVLEECARRGKSGLVTIAQVRGDAYTSFLRDAKAIIASRGKRMRINLNTDWFRPDPPPSRQLAYPANIHFNWKHWVQEGLLDEGILRTFALPFITLFDDAIVADMITSCSERKIPLTVNRYINPNYPEEFVHIWHDGRFSGFILYEAAEFLYFQNPAECTFQNETVSKVCAMLNEGKP